MVYDVLPLRRCSDEGGAHGLSQRLPGARRGGVARRRLRGADGARETGRRSDEGGYQGVSGVRKSGRVDKVARASGERGRGSRVEGGSEWAGEGRGAGCRVW